jgi:hypothetical protein
MVSQAEEIVNDLLGAMLAALQRLTIKKHELSTGGRVSEVSISVSPFTQGDTSLFGLDVYLDASFDDGASAVWYLTGWRHEEGWKVERDVTLRPGEGEDVVRRLPTVPLSGSGELAASLPDLLDELLNMELPAAPEGESRQA